MKRAALLVRFPRMRQKFASYPVISREAAAPYPELTEDIDVADDIIGSAFAEADLTALRDQNRYRRQQVIVILGAVLLSGLGGLQAVFPEQRWPGVALVVVSLLLTFAARTAGELGSFDAFLDQRVRAERLRSSYFRFLSRTGRYQGTDRVTQLRRAVVSIKKGEEPV